MGQLRVELVAQVGGLADAVELAGEEAVGGVGGVEVVTGEVAGAAQLLGVAAAGVGLATGGDAVEEGEGADLVVLAGLGEEGEHLGVAIGGGGEVAGLGGLVGGAVDRLQAGALVGCGGLGPGMGPGLDGSGEGEDEGGDQGPEAGGRG